LKATGLEANPEKTEATVRIIGTLKDRFEGLLLAVRRHGLLSRRAVPARRKGCSHKGPTIEKR
jgi:hypothetical protein